MKIGLIGTGMMGSAIARRLLSKGYDVIVYNRSKEKAEALKLFNAKVVYTPRDVGYECDFILTVLKDHKALESVLFKEGGLVESKRSLTIANVSTISPIHVKDLHSRLASYNITLLDTPVMGGPQLAENGELIVMAAGDKTIIDKYEGVFNTIGKKIFFLGKEGSASAMKLALNLQIALIALALSEGITLIKGLKLDPSKFLEILNSTYFKTGISERKGSKMIDHNFEKTFALNMMLKDLYTINFTAKEYNLTLPMSSLAEELYRAADNLGYGELDYTGILAFIEEINGLDSKDLR